MIKIDKNVPTPNLARDPNTKYPFREMDVGDSFFAGDRTTAQMSVNTQHYRPKKFTCRTVTENGVKGVRVWRIG